MTQPSSDAPATACPRRWLWAGAAGALIGAAVAAIVCHAIRASGRPAPSVVPAGPVAATRPATRPSAAPATSAALGSATPSPGPAAVAPPEYFYRPYGSAYFVGQTVTVTAVVEPEAVRCTYRLRHKRHGTDLDWQPVGDGGPSPRHYTFAEPGLVSLHVDRRIGATTTGTWLGQFFVSPAAWRDRRTSLLRRLVARNELEPCGGQWSCFGRAVAQEAIVVNLLLLGQQEGWSSSRWDQALGEFAGAGLSLGPASDGACEIQREIAPPATRPTTTRAAAEPDDVPPTRPPALWVDRRRGLLRVGPVRERCRPEDLRPVADALSAVRDWPLRARVAVGMAAALHSHFRFSRVPRDPITRSLPALVQRYGHCGTYQTAMDELLRGGGYQTRRMGVVYGQGAVHVFNEIRVEGVVYTLDASSAVVFAGSVERFEAAGPLLRLPAVWNLANALWNAPDGRGIAADTLRRVEAGEW